MQHRRGSRSWGGGVGTKLLTDRELRGAAVSPRQRVVGVEVVESVLNTGMLVTDAQSKLLQPSTLAFEVLIQSPSKATLFGPSFISGTGRAQGVEVAITKVPTRCG